MWVTTRLPAAVSLPRQKCLLGKFQNRRLFRRRRSRTAEADHPAILERADTPFAPHQPFAVVRALVIDCVLAKILLLHHHAALLVNRAGKRERTDNVAT